MKEALKLALDALEYWDVHGMLHQPTEEAITALRLAIDVQNMASESTYKAALAQQADHSEQHLDMVKAQQEPWCMKMNGCTSKCEDCPVEVVEQEPVAYFDWLPNGATHIGRIKVKTRSGGRLEMGAYVFKYDNEVLMVYKTDNDNEYPGWREAKECFYHLNFQVHPIPTAAPPAQQEPWCMKMNGCKTKCEDCPVEVAQQEPVAYLCENAVGHKYFRWKKPSSTYKPIPLYTTPPQPEERNFCPRCGKRTADLTVIHTCTPPQETIE